MSRKHRLLRVLGGTCGLGLLAVDVFKAGFQITTYLPQTEAWDQINTLAFAAEGFLGLNLGNLLPGHSWAVLGASLIVAALVRRSPNLTPRPPIPRVPRTRSGKGE